MRRIRPELEKLEDRIVPAPLPPPRPIMVTSATDDGAGLAGTLSAAINQANKNPGSTIAFNIKGTSTITVTGALPTITASVTINGYSQGGSTATPGTPYVELKGPGPNVRNMNGVIDGLEVTAGGVLIEGLAIDNFSGNGI